MGNDDTDYDYGISLYQTGSSGLGVGMDMGYYPLMSAAMFRLLDIQFGVIWVI